MNTPVSYQVLRDSCDRCGGRRLIGVTVFHNGTPTFHGCRDCDRSLFERVSQQGIDAWLKTGKVG
jgi:hypothetical protein